MKKFKSVPFLGFFMVVCFMAVSLATASEQQPPSRQQLSPDGEGQAYLPIMLKPQSLSASRRVNVPFDMNTALPRRTIFWFGQVNASANYADARLVYDNEQLYVTLHIFDRHTWYDTTPSNPTLTEWDAATLYLNLNGNAGGTPTGNSYQFVAQLNNPPQNRAPYEAAYRGNGSGWSAQAIPFSSFAAWSGVAVNNNNQNDRGWTVSYEIPFSSLGLGSQPPAGTIWGLSVAVHDRDAQGGSFGPTQRWPEMASHTQPGSWGQLHFGLPTFTPPTGTVDTAVIRNGQNGATVVDAHVGGGFDCGEQYNPNFFNGWGDHNYANHPNFGQMNVQNQSNLGDWPCLSKIYITFPLNQIPANRQITDAELTLRHFGNSNPAQAQDSFVHILTVGEPWSEQSITWNNAPLARENITVERFSPVSGDPCWPCFPRTWDVSKAVADAYAAGEPLRLVLYSTDSALHSGKYFYSSNADLAGRPTLTVSWGN